MKIQLIVLATNQEDSSNERKKSRGANKIFTNKYCIPSKNDFIMYKINFINCFWGTLESKKSYLEESFWTCRVYFLNKYYIYEHKSIKYPYDNKCF